MNTYFFKLICLSLVLLSGFALHINAQELATVYTQQIEGGYQVLTDNQEPCPVSIEVNMNLKNMESTDGNNKVFVVPANSRGHLLTTLLIKDRKVYSSFDINTMASHGDAHHTAIDKNHLYQLPYKEGANYLIMQGYNGKFSHQGTYALDFDIPEGGQVLASRGGVVVTVVDHNHRSCSRRSCHKYNNYIRIYHDDGTFAEYSHIDTGSAQVRKGERIEAGQHIANCGAIGWTTGPHLHFEVYTLNKTKKRTIPTLFATKAHPEGIQLVSKNRYVK